MEKNQNFMLLAIIAIVAIVGVVVMFTNGGNTNSGFSKTAISQPMLTEGEEANLAGESVKVKSGTTTSDGKSALWFQNGANIQAKDQGLVFNIKSVQENVWTDMVLERDGTLKVNKLLGDEIYTDYVVSGEFVATQEMLSPRGYFDELYINGINIYQLLNQSMGNPGVTYAEVKQMIEDAKLDVIETIRNADIVESSGSTCDNVCAQRGDTCIHAETQYLFNVLGGTGQQWIFHPRSCDTIGSGNRTLHCWCV